VEWLNYIGKLALAQREWEDGNGVYAVQLLSECQWNLRGWEHRHLWTRFHPRQIFAGHAGAVTAVAFSPDGWRLVSASTDQTLKVWDAVTADGLLVLKGHAGPVTSVAYGPGGVRIVSGSADKTVKVRRSSPRRSR
jgi:WD40 repeat protein